jgi:PTH1 family peptidyl-tRNA hydrolase
MMIDRIAEALGERVERLNGRSLVCSTNYAGREIVLAKPQTYMNLSGFAVKELVQRGQFELSQCVVIYDEVSLPLGKTRFRPSGGAGGHKGMRSVLQALGTEKVPRLRIGIAGRAAIDNLTGYVLSRFKPNELTAVEEVLDSCYSALEVFLTEGIDRTMALYN